MSRRVGVYADTNVLYPYYISDLLLWLASDGVIRLVWTQYLVDEVTEAQWRTKMSLARGPDSDDHPHQAAAIYANADYLLTHDSRGFPVGPLLEHGVLVTGVDDFLCTILAEQRDDVLATVQSRARSLTRPPMTLERYLEALAVSAPQFAERAAGASDTRLSRLARLRVRLHRMSLRQSVIGSL